MSTKRLLLFIIAIVICFVPAIVGSIFTAPAIPTWYAGLIKPPFSPPRWVFGPVWTALYLMMGIALYLIWKGGTKEKTVRIAVSLFLVQLVLNGLWTTIFFGLRAPGWALVEIVVLWVFILLTIIASLRVSRAASYLLIPYIVWVSFAALLNGAIVSLNR